MFEDLDKIDWKNIHHSHGTAEMFPVWLRSLARGTDAEWELFEEIDEDFWEEANSALHHISEFSNHQGSIYEVTPVVLPFIIELLQVVPVKRQRRLLELLEGYARGEQLVWDYPFRRQVAEKRGEDFDAKLRASKDWVTRTRTQLHAKLLLFNSYLESEDVKVRQAAERLIKSINSHPVV